MKEFTYGASDKYKEEAREKWGNTRAYKEYEEKTSEYSEEKHNALADSMDRIMAEFSDCMKKGEEPFSAAAQGLVKKLQAHISESCYNCTDEILAGLGQMYAADERFRKNIDRHEEGTAEFISNAIRSYCCK